MPRLVDADDVVDAHAVAEMLGLAQRNTVSLYQRRYPDMPRPVIELGRGRCKLRLRADIARWVRDRTPAVPARNSRRGTVTGQVDQGA